jgi:hypothetical protein
MIPREQLQRVVLEVAVARFGNEGFARAQLRAAVEEYLRANAMWATTDDDESQSTDPKSTGQANIDYRISDLASLRLITSVRWNFWRVGAHEEGDDDRPPDRIPTTVLRTVRDTALAKLIKAQCGHLCQVCQIPLAQADGNLYAEAHHVRPLAARHGGLDRADNILVLCPNHHALFDLGVPEFVSPSTVRITGREYPLTPPADLAPVNIEYHNARIRRR